MSGGVQTVVDGINAAYTSSSSGVSVFLLSTDQGATKPSAFINYILFDENYVPLEAKSTPLAASPGISQLIVQPTVNAKEAGILFIYLSYDNESAAPVYFDDLKIIHKFKTSRVIAPTPLWMKSNSSVAHVRMRFIRTSLAVPKVLKTLIIFRARL
jgi:hypothetical protein